MGQISQTIIDLALQSQITSRGLQAQSSCDFSSLTFTVSPVCEYASLASLEYSVDEKPEFARIDKLLDQMSNKICGLDKYN